MNNTIDFKTAKTIDSMSKKLDHIDDAVSGFFSVIPPEDDSDDEDTSEEQDITPI